MGAWMRRAERRLAARPCLCLCASGAAQLVWRRCAVLPPARVAAPQAPWLALRPAAHGRCACWGWSDKWLNPSLLCGACISMALRAHIISSHYLCLPAHLVHGLPVCYVHIYNNCQWLVAWGCQPKQQAAAVEWTRVAWRAYACTSFWQSGARPQRLKPLRQPNARLPGLHWPLHVLQCAIHSCLHAVATGTAQFWTQ